ncbi:MAG TPA: four helix bundle protein [Pelobium sp.]|nr:four helix bundle protein [Pelobium sp.]
MQDYKELQVWKKSHQFTLEIYKITKSFPKEEIFALVSQLRRASSSIPTNIAEGCGRFTQKDFASFLQISLGSSQEAEYLIFLSKELNYINETEFVLLNKSIGEIKAMLISLIKKVRL